MKERERLSERVRVREISDLQCLSNPPGSYDHTIRMFDARTDKSVMTMDHSQPVESVLLYPTEGLLVSAGEP